MLDKRTPEQRAFDVNTAQDMLDDIGSEYRRVVEGDILRRSDQCLCAGPWGPWDCIDPHLIGSTCDGDHLYRRKVSAPEIDPDLGPTDTKEVLTC